MTDQSSFRITLPPPSTCWRCPTPPSFDLQHSNIAVWARSKRSENLLPHGFCLLIAQLSSFPLPSFGAFLRTVQTTDSLRRRSFHQLLLNSALYIIGFSENTYDLEPLPIIPDSETFRGHFECKWRRSVSFFVALLSDCFFVFEQSSEFLFCWFTRPTLSREENTGKDEERAIRIGHLFLHDCINRQTLRVFKILIVACSNWFVNWASAPFPLHSSCPLPLLILLLEYLTSYLSCLKIFVS